jgi:hypothetical protein
MARSSVGSRLPSSSRKTAAQLGSSTTTATSPVELLAELGDVLQILYALAAHAGLEPAAIEAARARKDCTHGTYTHRILWQPSTQEAMT